MKTKIKHHVGWESFFTSKSGISSIVRTLHTLDNPNYLYSNWQSTPTVVLQPSELTISSEELWLKLVKRDPRLIQFLPNVSGIASDLDSDDVIALLDLTGLLSRANTKKDLLFTTMACLAHGIVKIVSAYSSGTDECDLQDTDVWFLKDGVPYEAYGFLRGQLEVAPEKAEAIFNLYNLDAEILFNELNTDSGAGSGDIYDMEFKVELLTSAGLRADNETICVHPSLEDEEEQ